MRASGIFFCIRIGDFCIVPISVSRRAGMIMRFSGVRIAVFFFAVGDSQKQKGLCLLARFLKMPPFGNKKAPAFSHENRCVERCSLWAWKVTISPF